MIQLKSKKQHSKDFIILGVLDFLEDDVTKFLVDELPNTNFFEVFFANTFQHRKQLI